jgi:thioredoxin 1
MSENIVHVTDETFDDEVLKSNVPVLVDFWAPWCGPCLVLGPVMESIARHHEGDVKVAKINVDQNTSVAGRMGIRSIPAVMLFYGGEMKEMTVGARPEAFFEEMLNRSVLRA